MYGLEVISYDLVYGFQILSHLILFFADGFPPIFLQRLRWISTIFILLLRWISTNFYATTEMDFHQFFCYYCGVGFDSFQNVLDHTCDFHGNMVLKVKKAWNLLLLQENLDSYLTIFGIFPFAIKNKQQIISVKNDEPGSLAITILP